MHTHKIKDTSNQKSGLKINMKENLFTMWLTLFCRLFEITFRFYQLANACSRVIWSYSFHIFFIYFMWSFNQIIFVKFPLRDISNRFESGLFPLSFRTNNNLNFTFINWWQVDGNAIDVPIKSSRFSSLCNK